MSPDTEPAELILNLQNQIATRLDTGFQNVRNDLKDHMEGVRSEFREENHRIHERIDERDRRSEARLLSCAERIDCKADAVAVSAIAATQTTHGNLIARLSAKQRLIIYILTGSGAAGGAGAIILKLFTV